jgi:hypothetical protein
MSVPVNVPDPDAAALAVTSDFYRDAAILAQQKFRDAENKNLSVKARKTAFYEYVALMKKINSYYQEEECHCIPGSFQMCDSHIAYPIYCNLCHSEPCQCDDRYEWGHVSLYYNKRTTCYNRKNNVNIVFKYYD